MATWKWQTAIAGGALAGVAIGGSVTADDDDQPYVPSRIDVSENSTTTVGTTSAGGARPVSRPVTQRDDDGDDRPGRRADDGDRRQAEGDGEDDGSYD